MSLRFARFVKSRWYKTIHNNIVHYKIIWIVCGFWLIYKSVFIALWNTKITWAMWFDCLRVVWEFTVSTSYIVFLFVNNDNNNFIKEINHVVSAFIAWWKPRRTFGRIPEQISENPRRRRTLPRFSIGYVIVLKYNTIIINLSNGL